ncbi:hypothetical protein [Geomesophilobacter sediminis]|uniref:Uncharacterized protein n=1 Tax=Geomesophilobacter sediminis TaxID=2798584 RepID=A0A8J7LWF8_9BACT|nr:hypothetical protein [Geomesophilobacter sediminis]MBJ6725725.1 hypothetical protein [Geomesophilobacter sediminis]
MVHLLLLALLLDDWSRQQGVIWLDPGLALQAVEPPPETVTAETAAPAVASEAMPRVGENGAVAAAETTDPGGDPDEMMAPLSPAPEGPPAAVTEAPAAPARRAALQQTPRPAPPQSRAIFSAQSSARLVRHQAPVESKASPVAPVAPVATVATVVPVATVAAVATTATAPVPPPRPARGKPLTVTAPQAAAPDSPPERRVPPPRPVAALAPVVPATRREESPGGKAPPASGEKKLGPRQLPVPPPVQVVPAAESGATRQVTASPKGPAALPAPAAAAAPLPKPVHVDPVRSAEAAAGPGTAPPNQLRAFPAVALDGDLVLKIRSKGIAGREVKPYVIFRDYPKSRHNRGMTAAEASRKTKLRPRSVALDNDQLQVVVDTAADGVYDFRAGAEPAGEGACTLTITGRGGKKVKPVGTRAIGGDNSLVKVLMPEGVLWDEDGPFTGSIEDSESVTKYNGETGLVWKEYKP